MARTARARSLAPGRARTRTSVATEGGGDAVHLRLQTDGTCPELGWTGKAPSQLRGVVHGVDAEPGWPGQHVLDLWHLVVPGPEPASILVASWDLDGTPEHHEQQRELLESLRIEGG